MATPISYVGVAISAVWSACYHNGYVIVTQDVVSGRLCSKIVLDIIAFKGESWS